jgi:anti-sigma regulatory factor (Ser/Thr protein kinase)
MVERKFSRAIHSIEHIFEFVSGFMAANGLSQENSFYADLVIEELFTNMVKYSKESTQDIAVRLERDGDNLIVTLRDFDVDAFDVTRAGDANVHRPIAERRRGGLGLHLVRQMVDRIDYRYEDRTSTITVTRKLER